MEAVDAESPPRANTCVATDNMVLRLSSLLGRAISTSNK
jgi:hypothetical protein